MKVLQGPGGGDVIVNVLGVNGAPVELTPVEVSAPTSGNIVIEQTTAPYSLTQGDAPVAIASVTITVQAQSRVRLDAMAGFQGSVAPGRAFVSVAEVASQVASEAFDVTTGTNFRTLNYLGVTDPLSAGDHTFDLVLDMNADATAHIASASATCFIATELLTAS